MLKISVITLQCLSSCSRKPHPQFLTYHNGEQLLLKCDIETNTLSLNLTIYDKWATESRYATVLARNTIVIKEQTFLSELHARKLTMYGTS